MILDRTILRMAAVAALDNFQTAPYPTLAGSMIFDSRIEPVEDFKEDRVFPVCVVYTDYDKDHWDHLSTTNRDRLLTVTFELLVAQITEIPETDDEQAGFLVTYPNTDSELETSLDLFEFQVATAFTLNNPAADCWRHLMRKHVNVISRRGATVEGGTKLAARQITIEAVLPRGPANGNIAPAIEAFLDAAELKADYKDRIPLFRQAYQSAAALTANEQVMRVLGWSDGTSARLGYEWGVQPVLSQPIVWSSSDGNPLP